MATADPLNDAPAERQGAGAINAGRAVAAALRVSGGLLQGIPISPNTAPQETIFYYYDPLARESGPGGELQRLAIKRWGDGSDPARFVGRCFRCSCARNASLQIPDRSLTLDQ